MKRTWWQVINVHGLYVCRRKTLRECKDLLDSYSGKAHWKNGPYRIQKIEERDYAPSQNRSEGER